MDLQLAGKKALITGGSRGIGRAIAISMANEGCHLHLASRVEADLQQAKAKITETTGSEVLIHPFDLSQSGNITQLAEACADVDIFHAVERQVVPEIVRPALDDISPVI